MGYKLSQRLNKYTLSISLKVGGAISVEGGSLALGENEKNNHYFLSNSPTAIRCNDSQVAIAGNSSFQNNGPHEYVIIRRHYFTSGGAINVLEGTISIAGTCIFHYNQANAGGALSIEKSAALLNGTVIEFKGNTAWDGGAIWSIESNLTITAKELVFVNNRAWTSGGAILTHATDKKVEITSGNFYNNTGKECGGAVSMVGKHDITFVDTTATENSQSAFCIDRSKVTFKGYADITSNFGKFGGAINCKNSILVFSGNVNVQYNEALIGGAIHSFNGEITFEENGDVALFAYNAADLNGGAFYAMATDVTLKHSLYLVSNSAQNGGALYFKLRAVLTIDGVNVTLISSHNNASEFGGVLFVEDTVEHYQCTIDMTPPFKDVNFEEIPHCPLQVHNNQNFRSTPVPLTSYLNAARKGGFMYGGLLDRCTMNGIGNWKYSAYYYFKAKPDTNVTEEVTSSPYQLCFCDGNDTYDCSVREKSLTTHRGQRMKIVLVALDQLRNAVLTPITAITSATATLELNQSPQNLCQSCSNLTYNIYSTENHERLILYPDGPCHDTGQARAVLSVTILPCPDGFIQSASGEKCICEEILDAYGAECGISDEIYIRRKAGLSFWVSALKKMSSATITEVDCCVENVAPITASYLVVRGAKSVPMPF